MKIKEYINEVDYFICPDNKTPCVFYQHYKTKLYRDEIYERDVAMFKNKIIYIFFSNISIDVLQKIIKVCNKVYYITTFNKKYIDITNIDNNNFNYCLINMDVDEYLADIKRII